MQNLETENKSGETTTQEMADTAEAMQQEEQTEDNRVTFTAAELEGLIQKAARAAVAEYKKQEEKDRKQNKYHNTFMLMKCYRDAAFHIENAISDGEQRTYLESIRRSRFKTLIMTAHIDKAVEEIERRRKAADREIEYKAFEMYFMQGMDYAKIAEELDTGNSTPRRWITAIINELSVLLWGMDEDKIR